MTSILFSEIRQKLEAEWKRLTGEVREGVRESRSIDPRVSEESDAATTSSVQEMALRLAHRRVRELADIDDALNKMDAGQYGICEECRGKIDHKRLQARPMVRCCIDCQRQREHLGVNDLQEVSSEQNPEDDE